MSTTRYASSVATIVGALALTAIAVTVAAVNALRPRFRSGGREPLKRSPEPPMLVVGQARPGPARLPLDR